MVDDIQTDGVDTIVEGEVLKTSDDKAKDAKPKHKPAIKTFRYPLEGLGKEKGLKSYVRFAPVTEPVFGLDAFQEQLKKIGTGITNFFADAEDKKKLMELFKKEGALGAGTLDAAGDLLLGMIPQIFESLSNAGKEAFAQMIAMKEAFDGEGETQLLITDSKYKGLKDRGDIAVMLYMSPAQSFSDGVKLGELSLGGGDQARLAKMAGKSVSASEVLTRGAATIGSILKGNSNKASDMAAGLALQNAAKIPMGVGGLVAKTGIPQVAGVGTRTVATNHYRFIFKGVEFRTFQFAFSMKAESKLEALEIRKIIKTFREELYPTKLTAVIGGDSEGKGAAKIEMGYKYPDRFNISMMHEGKPVLHKIKPCYLESMKTTYNGEDEAMNAFRKGYDTEDDGGIKDTFEPITVSFELSFKESLKLNKQDIKNGY
jgi:hypothetical protein